MPDAPAYTTVPSSRADAGVIPYRSVDRAVSQAFRARPQRPSARQHTLAQGFTANQETLVVGGGQLLGGEAEW